MAAAHERGPAFAVEARWQRLFLALEWMYARNGRTATRGTLGLVVAARAEPRLRRLYPFTSHATLCLSSCTRYPYTIAVPPVEPLHDGRFRVRVPRSRDVIGVTDTAEEAIALVLDHLPADVGPAVAGTADDLGP
ncbi:DUF6193 family natural product biosynthesis protein [Embleya sp. NPDC001921]